MLKDGIESVCTVASGGSSAKRDANGGDGVMRRRRRESLGDGGEGWGTELIKGLGNGGADFLPSFVKGFGLDGCLEVVGSGGARLFESRNYTNGG